MTTEKDAMKLSNLCANLRGQIKFLLIELEDRKNIEEKCSSSHIPSILHNYKSSKPRRTAGESIRPSLSGIITR